MFKKITLTLFLFPFVSSAWEMQNSPSCSKPYKPYEFSSRDDLNRFMDDVENYKQCINDFIDEENQSIQTHQDAINSAIDEWNNFVNIELN